MAGDAAQPVTPHRDQGLNNAFQDAANFVSVVTSVSNGRSESFKTAVDLYDKEVFGRGKREIEISYQQSYAHPHWDVYMRSTTGRHGDCAMSNGEAGVVREFFVRGDDDKSQTA